MSVFYDLRTYISEVRDNARYAYLQITKVREEFQKLTEERDSYLEALEFYANKDSFYTQWQLDNPKWKDTGGEWTGNELILEDYGEKARTALEKYKDKE